SISIFQQRYDERRPESLTVYNFATVLHGGRGRSLISQWYRKAIPQLDCLPPSAQLFVLPTHEHCWFDDLRPHRGRGLESTVFLLGIFQKRIRLPLSKRRGRQLHMPNPFRK